MTAIVLIVTTAGRAALINAAHDGTGPTRISAVGISQSSFVADKANTVVPGEFARLLTVSGIVADAETMHLTVSDDGPGAYSLHGFGLYLADGTLLALYGQPASIADKVAGSTLLLALDVRFADIAAAALSFGSTNFLNPPATTEVVGVVELATPAEAVAGTDAARAVTPAALKATIDGRFGANSASVFVKTLLTAATAVAFRLLLGIKSAALKDEGSGGGLDADTVDGYHAGNALAWPFLPVVGSGGVVDIGYALDFHSVTSDPADYTVRLTGAAGKLFTNGALNWNDSNDGAGSGLDADILDGQQGSWYADVTGRLGFTPVNRQNAQIDGNAKLTSHSFASGPSVTLDNRGANTADSTAYRIGGYYFAAYRDIASPAYVAGVYAERTAAAAGLASQGALIFATSIGGAPTPAGLVEQLRIAPGGYVGIGTANPQVPLQVSRDNPSASFSVVGRFTNTGLTSGVDLGYLPSGVPYVSSTFGGPLAIQPAGGAATINGSVAWHAGNDGAGSGLDADLLDGIDSASFLRRDVAGSWQLASNTGSPSFNYAALQLRELNYGAGQTGSLGEAPRLAFHWAGQVASQIMMWSDGSIQVRDNPGTGYQVLRAGPIFANDAIVWNAGNDGAGSGLDADLLDGRDSSSFSSVGHRHDDLYAPVAHGHGAADIAGAFPHSFNANGWQQLPGGLILQWGKVRQAYSGEQFAGSFAFPREFPNACLNVTLSSFIAFATNQRDLWPQLSGEAWAAGFSVYLQAADGNDNRSDGFNWFAIGF